MQIDNRALLPVLRSGCEDTRQRMIEGNMPLAFSLVNSLIATYPQAARLKDDLEGVALLALTVAVTRMAEPEIEAPADPVNYINSEIIRRMGDALTQDGSIPVPASSVRAARANGREIIPQVEAIEVDRSPGVADPTAMVELVEEVMACAVNETERAIMEHRVAGRDVDTTAELVGLSPHTVYHHMRVMRDRYEERCR